MRTSTMIACRAVYARCGRLGSVLFGTKTHAPYRSGIGARSERAPGGSAARAHAVGGPRIDPRVRLLVCRVLATGVPADGLARVARIFRLGPSAAADVPHRHASVLLEVGEVLARFRDHVAHEIRE